MSRKPRASLHDTLATLRKIFPHVKRYWLLILLATVAVGIHGGIRTGLVVFTRDYIDKGLLTKSMEEARRLAFMMGGLAIVAFISNVGSEYLSNRIVLNATVDVRNRTCSNLLRQAISFFNKQRIGELMSRLTNDMGQLQKLLDSVVVEAVKEMCEAVGAIIGAIAVGGKLAILIFLIAPLLGVPLVAVGRRVRKYSRKVLDTLAEVVQTIHQMFTGIRVVKAFKMEDHEDEELDRIGKRFVRRSLKVVLAKSLVTGGLEASYYAAIAALVVGGTYSVAQGILSPGELMALAGAMGLVYKPVKTLSRTYTRVQECVPGVENVFKLAEIKPEISDHAEAAVLKSVAEGVCIEGVWFAYDSEPVLRDINLRVAAGQTVALVGPTGAGKSTLLDLVARFYDPTRGRITIDGTDLRMLRRDSIMDLIAIVSQEPFLFHTTIRENIRYGRPGATDDEIVEAARMAQMHDFIASLPHGYDTEMGERGATVSGGQRQRLTIARAILKNASILLLDEATSSLDTETEKLVQAALSELMKGKTTFVIAHRLSTVMHADLIVVLDRGEIVQKGAHDELLQQGGLYKKLHDMQFAVPATR